MDERYWLDPEPGLSMPTGVTYRQREAIRAATTTSTYSDGDYDFIIVVTRLATEDESSPGWFLDAQWVRYVRAEYEGWSFIDGTGDTDPGGPWFAQQQVNGDEPPIWVALGRRHRVEEDDDE